MQRARLAGVVVLLVLSGCKEQEDDEVSARDDAGGQGGAELADTHSSSMDGGQTGNLDGAAESFRSLYDEVIAPRCQDCHGTVDGGHTSARLALVPKEVALAQLINMPALGRSCADAGYPLVLPGKPEQSLFYLKLEPDPRCGTRMPRSLDGGTPSYLSDGDMARIRRWIEQGALDN